VTGILYDIADGDSVPTGSFPNVQLYTKEGCTLCDKVSDVLRTLREEQPHSLSAIDITDPDKTEMFDKYKWDIPVLHMDGKYWTKHRLDVDEAKDALIQARTGDFVEQDGEPNAAEMEKRMEERKTQ